MPYRLIRRIVQFRHGEASTAWLMFAYSFLAMTAHNVLKPISKSRFILSFGADNLPYIQLIAGVIIGALMVVYGWGVAQLPRRSIIPVTLGVLLGLVLAFWLLFRLDAEWVSAAFFVFSVMLGIFLVSQFWTLANEVYDARQARRIFGFIGGGASLGGALGAGVTAWTVSFLGLDNLLLVSAASLGACVALASVVVSRQPPTSSAAPTRAAEERAGTGEAIGLLRRSRHLQILALVIGCAAIGATLIDQQLSMAAAAFTDTDTGLTAFLAEITFYLSLVSFFVQVGLTSHIHRSLGLTIALLVLPISLGVAAAAVLITGALWAIGLAKVLDSSLRYSLDKTTREVLFLPLPPDLKLRAKAFIDVTVDRMAKALGNVLALALIKPWGLGLDWVRLSYASLTILALWVGVAVLARREYLRAFRRSLESRQIEPAAVRVPVADPATMKTLVGELASPDASAVLYAIEMLETLGQRHLVPPRLLHHHLGAVRARALAAIAVALPIEGVDTRIPAIRHFLTDPDAVVRAAAVRALATRGDTDLSELLTRSLEDGDPRVVVAAAAELADSGRAEDVAAAQAAIGRLTLESDGSAAAGRRDAADALARIRNPACRSLLVPLLHDRDPEVARAAISSARALGPGDTVFVPALVSRLGHRVLKRAARGALVSYGEEVVPVLAHLLADPHEQPWVRRHIPGTLSRIPVQASMDALFAVVTDPDGFLRYKIVTAIETLHRRHPTLSIRPDAVERLIVRESARYYTYLTLRFNLIQQGDGARRTLAVVALEDKLARTLDRLYRELGLLYPWQDVAAARRAIESGDARARANALEFLDTLLSSALRRRVMPILDEMPMSDKVRVANSLLKTRPRGLDETLVQLVHDDDPVVAASAIEMVVQQAIDTLDDDLEFVVTRGTADGIVIDAATWARTVLAERRATGRREVRARPLPDVRLADRLRAIPLFARVSVDELFRVAATARQIAHDRGRDLAARGAAATDVWLLVEGTVRLRNGDEPLGIITAPAALALEEALEGRPLGYTMTALDAMVCLALPVGDLLTMLSDNIAMAQGLFRTLLTDRRTPGADWLPAGRDVVPAAVPAGPLTAVDKARLLRQNPLFCRASVEHLLALSAVTREVGLPAGTALPRERESIAAFHLLQGEVRIDDDGTGPRVVGPGGTVFVEETLAGTSPRYRAMVTREGRALRLDHEDLFDVLADHTDLLQDVFSGIVGARRA